MKQLTSDQIRKMFLDYFAEHGHMVEPGASLVPHNDPTLLWINSGVAALKKYFDGTEKPKNKRITNAQKSIRTNDIENVGKTARHHTFFEMLGNFSIGDYFKKEAIFYAWDFFTNEKWMGFDKDKLYVSIYIDDEEAYDIWVNDIGLDPKRILKSEDNYWQIGVGPCGPNTEIFYDRGEKYDPEGLGEKLFFEELENDRYIEVWNVVFSQYNAEEGIERKDYKELPQKNIDTGMGLERLVSIVQDGETNFDTDLFLPIIKATEKMTSKKYEGINKMAYRVIADHIRTVTFALADGATFSNEGRGYILRRVLRRAIRYGKQLDIKGAYMYKLVPVVAENMKGYYPYLMEKIDYVQVLVKAEEERFDTTLNDGEKILQSYLSDNTSKVLDGEVVFKLYDTYGFPLELTKEIAEDKGLTIDQKGFDRCMELQRERARSARSDDQSMSKQSVDLMNFTKESEFVGYGKNENTSKVIGLFKNGEKVDELTDSGEVVFEETCFYAESGGQIYDTGLIFNDNTQLEVIKVTKAPFKQHLHTVKVNKGSVKMGDEFTLKINAEDRNLIKANHSSLHLLHAALHEVIGSHVNQAGSYVCKDYGRFDFTHYEKLSDSQIKEIERLVNEKISNKLAVVTELMSIEEARKSGAVALFDEKYDDEVRVVSMGEFSKELCGGTHVANTSEVGIFKIIFEESIGSGIRRITSKTNYKAYEEYLALQQLLESLAVALKVNSITKVSEKLQQLLKENNDLNKTINELKDKLSVFASEDLVKEAIEAEGLKVIISKVDVDSSELKTLAQTLVEKLKDGVAFIYSLNDEKVLFTAACSQSAIAKGIKASDLVKTAAVICGGNGGGRPDLASAGGKDIDKLAEALNKVKEICKIN
ncbi:MAG TPA: alanine--tRNA ligase [Erysipelotrichaceae bacterium]|nr:alanine--tRNA ligase [Erysipelotrichaceae bacterium]HQA85820.1 alanine--tRNA ligase [Erysipelotrichaceae bacterium]